jgi:hypothetical protein
VNTPELQHLLDSLPPRTPPTLAQVRGRVRAFLLQRGRHLATDPSLDLDQNVVSDEDLIKLAELECVALHPSLSPRVACTLEMVVAERERSHTPPGPTQGNSSRTSTSTRATPEALPQIVPEAAEPTAASGVDPGQDGSRARAVGKTRRKKKRPAVKRTPMERFMSESMDAIDFDDDEE